MVHTGTLQKNNSSINIGKDMAGWTGLEPATSGVTGRRSNQLNYHPKLDCSQ